jgi:hypothetical protein
MELLTIGADGNHVEVIKRASRIYEDAPLALEVLKYIKDYRNHTAHTGEEMHGLQYTANQLRAFVEGLLVFYIKWIKELGGVSGVRDILALATSESALIVKLKKLKSTRKVMFTKVKIKPNS